MDFFTFKMIIISATGLQKDALHIYVGVSVYLICLFISRPILNTQSKRQVFALGMTTIAAILGEVFDTYLNIKASEGIKVGASIHDLINTCLLPYVLYALTRWTKIFHTHY